VLEAASQCLHVRERDGDSRSHRRLSNGGPKFGIPATKAAPSKNLQACA
jgi:hypothetical protein